MRCGARLDEVVRRPLEELHVGQNAERVRACCCVASGNFGGVEVLSNQALGGARLLDLGDEGGDFVRRLEGMFEPTRRLRGLCSVSKDGERCASPRLCDLFAFGLEDGLEDAHGTWLASASAWSLAIAAPEATALRARSAPSARSPATPASHSAVAALGMSAWDRGESGRLSAS